MHLLTDDLEESFAASDEAVSSQHETFLGSGRKRVPDSHTFFQGSFAISDDAVLLQKEVRLLHRMVP